MTARPQMELLRVEKYVPTSSHGGMVAVVSNDYSHTYVKFNDYAALATRLAESEARAEAWKAFAEHQVHCAECAESVESCADGRELRDAAIAQEAEREAASA